MPLSYFPTLPENIWGNLDGNIELQTDLIDLIASKLNSVSNKNNLIINPNFKIWQKCSNTIAIANRTRSSNIATIETSKPHGYLTGENIQITNMTDSSYDMPIGIAVTVIDSTHFSYTNTGSDESIASETNGNALLTDRISIAADNASITSDRWLALYDSNNIILTPKINNGVQIESNSTGKFALVQIVPNKYIEQYIDGNFSASIKAKSDGTAKIKIAIISWDGAIDNTNNSVISNWNSMGIDPTLDASWYYESISAIYNLNSDYQTIKLEEVEIAGPSIKNIALMIWIESASAGEKINIDNVQLLTNDKIIEFVENSYEYDLEQCQRFYQKSYLRESPVYHYNEEGKTIFPTPFGTGDGNSFGTIHFSSMYKPPTIALISASNPPILGKWRVSTGSNIDVDTDFKSESSFSIINNSGFTISTSSISGHYVLSAEI